MLLRTESDVIDTLRGQEVTIAEIYDAVRDAGIADRDAGLDIVWGATDQRYKRRARNVLQRLAANGTATRTGRGRWLIDGTPDQPRRLLLFIRTGPPGVAELRLQAAVELLDGLAGESTHIDLILCDPPWGLGRQRAGTVDPAGSERTSARDHTKVVGGYVDVDPADYRAFTRDWVTAATGLLVPSGGQLAVVTGPQQAAAVQLAGEDAGLEFVNQIVVRRPFPMYTSRRFAHAHHVITVLAPDPDRRFFHPPADLPKARSGRDYPQDWWDDIGKHERRGLLRYDNSLPPQLVARTLQALTPGPDNGHGAWDALVVDPFCGGGTVAAVAVEQQRRVVAGDVNTHALRFSAARIVTEGADHRRAAS